MGPNEKKLITRQMAIMMILGGSALDGFNALIYPNLGKIAKKAIK